jgi:hypothetical protein
VSQGVRRFRITRTLPDLGLVRGDVVRYGVDEDGLPTVTLHRPLWYPFAVLEGLVADGCAESAPLEDTARVLSLMP